VELAGPESAVSRTDEFRVPDDDCKLFDEPPIELDGAGRLDVMAEVAVVSGRTTDAVVVNSSVELANELEAEDDNWLVAELEPAPFAFCDVAGTKMAGALLCPTMLGEDRSASTMMAHATPSSALTTGLSGNRTIFPLTDYPLIISARWVDSSSHQNSPILIQNGLLFHVL